MHIGLIIYNDLSTVSGGYLYDRMLVDYLRQRGDTVDVISLPFKHYCGHLLYNYAGALRDRVVNGGFDLVLQDELIHPSMFMLNHRLRGLLSCPVVAVVHHLRSSEPRGWTNTVYREIERRYLRSVDGFVFVSKHTARSVGELAGHRVPSVVAYPGRDRLAADESSQTVRSRVSQLGSFNILFIGNVIPRKGLHVLIDALTRLKDVNWQLDIAGAFGKRCGYTHYLFRKIIRAGMVKRINFLGPVSDADLVKYFRQSHLLAVPSLHEGFGIVYLEALGFGVPVIASSSGGAREIIAHGGEGFLLEPGDARALAARIRSLNDDRGLLLDMSLQALEKHKKFPTWNQSSALVRGFLEGFMKKRSIAMPEYEFGIYSRPQKQEVLMH